MSGRSTRSEFVAAACAGRDVRESSGHRFRMLMRVKRNFPAYCLAILILAALGPRAGFAETPATTKADNTSGGVAHESTLRGRVVCLAEEMHRLHGADLPTNHPHIFGFQTTAGAYYTLLRTKFSEGLFVDPELRKRELILKGRLFPGSQVFEMTNIQSVKDGVIYDVYYWCDVCAIKTLKPGECMCCQAPVVLTEKRIE